MTASRARIRRRGRQRQPFTLRRAAGLLGVLALLIQVVVGLIPMPLALGDSATPAVSGDLCLAPDSPLAHRSNQAGDTKGKAGDPAQNCQICLTLQLAGHFLPAVPAGVVPHGQSSLALLVPGGSEAPTLARHTSAAPRAPPAIG